MWVREGAIIKMNMNKLNDLEVFVSLWNQTRHEETDFLGKHFLISKSRFTTVHYNITDPRSSSAQTYLNKQSSLAQF